MCCACLESGIFLHLSRADRECLQSRAEDVYTCFCMYQELGMYLHVFVRIIMCEPVSRAEHELDDVHVSALLEILS
jgi:hypothetical protein